MTSHYIGEEIRQRVIEQAKNRCGYCLSAQDYVMGPLEIEHIRPKSVGGSDNEDNLWLACRLCNGYKRSQIEAIDPQSNKKVTLFNPRFQKWSKHFEWSESGTHIIGRTPQGRATVVALQLNNQVAITVRRNWVSAGWHPPAELD
jgi:5-methylcytosine-specific restriction endonuclease McrA